MIVNFVCESDTLEIGTSQPFRLLSIDGIGEAPVNNLLSSGPLQHGAFLDGFRLQPRTIVLGFIIYASTEADLNTYRQQFFSMLHPKNSDIFLDLTFPDTTTRRIQVHYANDLQLTPEDIWPNQRGIVELLCPDPTFYDPVLDTENFALGAGGQSLEVPLAVPMAVGASTINFSQNINYAGTWETYPIIRIEGPAQNCVITNTTLDVKLDFTGITIAAGAAYLIDCRYGYKTVTLESDGSNKIADLTSDSDLTSFRIAAHPDTANGVNEINVIATGCTAATNIAVQYNERFVGV